MEVPSIPTPSTAALLLGVIDRPRQTLGCVVTSPRLRWLAPLAICLVAAAVFALASAQALSQQAQQQQALVLQQMQGQLDNMTEAQQQQMRQQMERFTSPLFMGGTTLVTRGVGLLVGWLLATAILYFGLAVGGTQSTFGAVFSGVSWTWLPFALRDLVAAGWTAVTGQAIANPGVSGLVASGDPMADARNPLWVLTSQIDLFFLWHIVLIYALIKAIRPRSSAVGLTALYTLVYLAIRLVPALLAARLSLGP